MSLGSACVVLHGHLPYVHHPDHTTFLEEDWLFEAILETYLPLLFVLDDLAADGVPVRLACGLTPPLLEMLRTPSLVTKAERFLVRRRELAEEEVKRLRGDVVNHPTARHYASRYLQLEKTWRRCGGDLVAAFRAHQDAGRIEILASAATHAILPLVATEALKRAQVRIGVSLYREVFGTAPRGFWLPECAYAPGLDGVLHEEGVRYVILETHGVEAAQPAPPAGVHRPIRMPSGLVGFGRDRESSRQVWSSEVGYPGDPCYRELYRDLGYDAPYERIRHWLHQDGVRRNLGIKYHRVTGDVALHDKQPYDAVLARRRAAEHADDYLHKRGEQAKSLFASIGEPAVILSPYDMELFGHWWYEGPHFLGALFRVMQKPDHRPPITLVTPEEVLRKAGSFPEAQPPLSTWGEEGYLKVWLNEKNDWVLRHQQELERRMIDAAGRFPERDAERAPLLDQMLRELLLLQSSDWAFIITGDTAAHYARMRVTDHVDRFLTLERWLDAPDTIDDERFEEIRAAGCIFPGLDYRVVSGGEAAWEERLGTSHPGLA